MFVHWSWTNQNIIEIYTWWDDFIFFSAKDYFLCLLWFELKFIFHWKVQVLMNFESLLISLAEVLTSWTTENKQVSSANNLHLLVSPFGKSLRYIKNKRGSRTELCGTLARISTQEEHWPCKTTLCFLLVNNLFSILIRFPHITFWHSL